MTLYHYTSPGTARAILEHGLEARDPDFASQPVGAYLSGNDRWGWYGDTVLAVEVRAHEVEPDPYYNGRSAADGAPVRAYYVPGEHGQVVVPPDRIKVYREKNLTPR